MQPSWKYWKLWKGFLRGDVHEEQESDAQALENPHGEDGGDLDLEEQRIRNNLKEKEMGLMTYIEKFHKLSIRGGLEHKDENVARHLNGLI